MRTRALLAAAAVAALLTPVIPHAVAAPTHKSPCAPGRITATKHLHTADGSFTVYATQKNEFEYFVCVVAPDGSMHKQTGVNLPAFGNGNIFRKDSLGHLFYLLQPGQISGVGVIVPDGKSVLQLGIYANAGVITHKGKPWAILKRHNDCNPSCAEGHVTKKILTWHPKQKAYKK